MYGGTIQETKEANTKDVSDGVFVHLRTEVVVRTVPHEARQQ